jgi:hypothetical protein
VDEEVEGAEDDEQEESEEEEGEHAAMAAEIEDPNKTALKQRFLDEINSRQGSASVSVLVDVVKEDDDEGSILWAKWFHPLADLWDLLRGEGRGRGGFRRLRDEEEEQGDNNNIGGGASADSSDDDEEEESDPEGYLVGRCFQELPEENLLQFFTEIFAWRPKFGCTTTCSAKRPQACFTWPSGWDP